MGAFPISTMPAHRRLHEITLATLDRCQEAQGVDFKESAPWDQLQWSIIRTVLGMGNLRDGGIIVIGISERSDTWDLTGISDSDLETYDYDDILDKLNSFISPPVEPEIALFEYRNGKTFLVFQINEFEDTPFVCKKDCPQDSRLQKGALYVRPPGKPCTKKIEDASQMHDLLDLAGEKRARKILEIAKRIGLLQAKTDYDKFEEELEGL
jgi:predicted HTH transcriptional regulator